MGWMVVVFYISAAIAVLATVAAITRLRPMHGLLYLVVSLLATAVMFYLLGAPFVAALEVIIYAGAIVVLLIFVVMLLNQGAETLRMEQNWMGPHTWMGPSLLAAILVAEVVYVVLHSGGQYEQGGMVGPRAVGLALYGPYLIGLELASFLLLAGLMGAYHLGRRPSQKLEIQHGADSTESRVDRSGDLVRVGTERSNSSP